MGLYSSKYKHNNSCCAQHEGAIATPRDDLKDRLLQ